MITIEKLMSLEKQQVEDEARILTGDDLAVIRRQQPSNKIDEYVAQALSGDILDRRTRKELEKLLAEQG